MSLLTDFLKLFKWDTTSETDLDEEFNVDKAMNENWDKIDAKAKEHDDSINTLEDVQAEQSSSIQKLKDNMINLSTEEDTSLYITDAGTPPASLKIRGNHRQEVQEGTDNLAVLNEGTIAKNGVTVNIQNGQATVSGTNTSTTDNFINVGTAYLYANQTYYLRRETGSMNGGYSLYKDGTTIWFNNNSQDKSQSIPKTGEWKIRYSMSGGSTVQGTFKVGIYKTSGTEWVQGKKAIPSLEYPSEIETVKDEVNVVVSNKNMFNVPSSNLYGVEITLQEDGSYLINGTSTASWAFRVGSTIPLEPGDYTLSIECNKALNQGYFGIQNWGDFKQELSATGEKHINLTETKKVQCYFTCNLGSTFDNVVVKVQLEKSNVKTDFMKHEEIKKTLDIQQEMLKGDDFDLENGKEVLGYEKKNMSEIDWVVSSNQLQEKTYCFMVMYSVAGLSSNEINCFSNCFKSYTGNYLWNNEVEGIAQSNTQIFVRIGKEKVADLNAFKALLAEKNAVVYVKNPTQLDLTETQKEVLNQLQNLDLFKGINNIYTEEGIALMQLDYSADTKMYIDNLVTQNTAESEG